MKSQHNLIHLTHKPTGNTYYTFAHWPQKDECYNCVKDIPDHHTQVCMWIPIDECEIISETPY